MLQHQLSSEHNRLKDLTRRNLTQLVESEFTLAHTMTDLAETELNMGNTEHALALLAKVREAIAAAQQALADVKLPEENEILRQLGDLEPRLQAVERQVNKGSRKDRGPHLSPQE